MRRNPATVHQWYNRVAVLGQHIVQLDGNLAAFCQIAGLAQLIQPRVIGGLTEPVDILALPQRYIADTDAALCRQAC